MGCCGSHTSDSVGGGCEMDHLYKSGNTLEIFRGPRSFKLFVTKHDAFQSKIHIPQMWLEAQHCVVHATGDLKVSVDGVLVEIPESHRQSKLNDFLMKYEETNYCSPEEPCVTESHEIGCLDVIPDWLKECQVSEYLSEKDFHITLEEHRELREEIFEILLETVRGPLRQCPRSYVPGTHVIFSHNDTHPCRAVIGESLSASTVVVKLLDTGKETIADLKMLSVLPSKASFLKYPPQAIRCSLRKNTFNTLDKNHLNRCAIKGTSLRIHFGMLVDGVWQVSLVGNQTVPSTFITHTNTDEVKSSLNYSDLNRLMQEELQISDKVKTCHIDHDNGFVWMQRVQDLEDLQLLEQLSADNSSSAKVVECHEVGQLYLGQSSVDLLFRRGLVLSKIGALLEVLFVDHGTTEFIPKHSARSLPASMKGFPRLSYCCVLSKSSMNRINQFRKKELEVVKCTKTDLIYQIKLHYNGMRLSSVEAETLQKEEEEKQLISEPQLELHVKHSFKIGHFETDGSVWLQLEGNIDKLSEVMSKIAVSEGHVGSIVPNKFCCCKFSLDGNWYRAQISRVISNEEVEVIYIDYGNREIAASHQLKLLPEDCSGLPMQAIHCRFYDSTTHSVFQGSDIQKQFSEPDVIEGELIQNDKFGLVLTNSFVNGEDLVDSLTSNSIYPLKTFFKNTPFECFNIKDISLSSRQDVSFQMVSVNSDASVWIRLAQYKSDLEKLKKLCTDVEPEELCRMPCDGEFYLCRLGSYWERCMVSSSNDNYYCDVLLVDTGESQTVSIDNMGILPKNLSTIPRQAVRCVLSCLNDSNVDDDVINVISSYTNKELSGILKVDMVTLSLEDVYEGSTLVDFKKETTSETGWGNITGWNVPDHSQDTSQCNGIHEVKAPPRKAKMNAWSTKPKEPSSPSTSVMNSSW